MSVDTSTKTAQTTIKVPVPLRQRIARNAAEAGVTAAAFLADLLDGHERDRRLASVGQAYRDAPDEDYCTLTHKWDTISGADFDSA